MGTKSSGSKRALSNYFNQYCMQIQNMCVIFLSFSHTKSNTNICKFRFFFFSFFCLAKTQKIIVQQNKNKILFINKLEKCVST